MPHICLMCKNSGVVMHMFPNPNKFPERFQAWLNLVGGKLDNLSTSDIYKNKRICDIHFTNEHRNRFNRLNALAVPTLYLQGPLHRFPKPEHPYLEKFNLWKNVLDLNVQSIGNTWIYNQIRFCNQHFERFYISTSNRLTSNAIPTLSLMGKQPISANSSTAAENDNETIEAITVEDTQDCQEDDDVVLEDQTYEVTQSENDVPDQSETNLHVGYKCNVCDSVIKGFRYVCVQCVDWDMCSGCEAKAAHSHHYVLRVPGPRPLNEIQPILERIRRELMELSVFIQDSIKQENDLGDQMDPLQEEVNSIGVVNTLPDIEDEQMNSTLIFDNIDHFASDNEVTNDTKQITTKISSVLPSTSNITKSKISAKNITNMETSGSSANNVTKSDGSVRPSAKYIVKCDSSVRPITRVANLQKSKFHIKKLTSKEQFSGNLKIINSKSFVKVERSDLKRILSHIRSQSTKNNE